MNLDLRKRAQEEQTIPPRYVATIFFDDLIHPSIVWKLARTGERYGGEIPRGISGHGFGMLFPDEESAKTGVGTMSVEAQHRGISGVCEVWYEEYNTEVGLYSKVETILEKMLFERIPYTPDVDYEFEP